MSIEKSCGAVVFTRIDNQIKYVIIREVEGFFGFPKGHVEGGESEEDTARREIFEETGLNITFIPGFRTTDEHPLAREGRPDVIKQIIYFLAEYEDQEVCRQVSEVSEICLLTFEEAIDAFQFESSKRILREADSYLKSRE